jgi:hypothetical protein
MPKALVRGEHTQSVSITWRAAYIERSQPCHGPSGGIL